MEASTASPGFAIRAATRDDVEELVRLIRALAEYERLLHLVQVTPQSLAAQLFGPRPAAEAVVATAGDGVVGFALFFANFSTFLGRPGLYLEDLFVEPSQRGRGVGRGLLAHLGALAVERGCGRFEWSVLDWNTASIGFYEKMGAQVLPDWRICRVSGSALQAFARDGG